MLIPNLGVLVKNKLNYIKYFLTKMNAPLSFSCPSGECLTFHI